HDHKNEHAHFGDKGCDVEQAADYAAPAWRISIDKHPVKSAMPRRKWQMPAAEKQSRDNSRPGDHGGIFTKKKKRELHRAVFRVITAGQFLLGFGEIEWQPIRFCKNRDRENHERNEHWNREQPFPWIHPIADERRDEPAMLDLIADDTCQAQISG